jgi:protein TonB
MKMLVALPLLLAAAPAFAADPAPAVLQSANGEIVFRDHPARSLSAAEQGKVGFAVKADPNGYPVSCSVTSSSGHPLLDSDTCRLLMVHATFKPLPLAAAGVLNTGVVN